MKKVAIVGVEGSGKTVMLAGLGELYSRPDGNGCFLAPKNYETASYVAEKIARMRRGEWPTATAEDVMQGLDWTLRQRQGEGRRPADVCEVSCLDFAGEVYRYAFVRKGAVPADLADEVESLKNYVRAADDLIVLINLRDIIIRGVHEPRVQEAMWITNAILSYALDEEAGRKTPRAAIVLSQADSYAETIKSCGGAKGVLMQYLPHVANNYDWLDIFAVSAVDKTVLDDGGNVVPAPDFQLGELHQIMDWVLDGFTRRPQARPPRVRPAPPIPEKDDSPIPPPPRRENPPAPRPSSSSGFERFIEQLVTASGRKNRASFWWFFLGTFFAAIVFGGMGGEWLALYTFAMIWPCTSMMVRRLHDMNRSGWWLLLGIIFFYLAWIFFLVLGCVKGTDGDNDYGPAP